MIQFIFAAIPTHTIAIPNKATVNRKIKRKVSTSAIRPRSDLPCSGSVLEMSCLFYSRVLSHTQGNYPLHSYCGLCFVQIQQVIQITTLMQRNNLKAQRSHIITLKGCGGEHVAYLFQETMSNVRIHLEDKCESNIHSPFSFVLSPPTPKLNIWPFSC